MAIRYLEQKYIDYTKWDRCINTSLNSEIYVSSMYLDTVAGSWDAIIENNYETVMPLVHTKKFMIKTIYQHPLIKYLGVFSGSPVRSDKIDLFLKAIPDKFRKIDMCLNLQNTQALKGTFSSYRNLYELDLIIPYAKKVKSYPVKVKKALDSAMKRRLIILKNTSVLEFRNLLHQNPGRISEKLVISPLMRVLSKLIPLNKAEISGVYGPENMLYAAACFIRSNQNVIMLFARTLKEGIESYANYLLLDSFLRDYSGRNVTLSMEHIDHIWNDEFYNEFGALKSYHYCYCKNRLPWQLKRF